MYGAAASYYAAARAGVEQRINAELRMARMEREAIEFAGEIEAQLAALPQVDMPTQHTLHAGMYARTILIPAGVALTGAHIVKATTLIISGHVRVFTGSDIATLEGYHVLAASAGRKQAFYALADTYLTMVYPTQAATVEEAEREFTDEPDKLMSRRDANYVTNTQE